MCKIIKPKFVPLGECSLELLSGLEDSGEGLALQNLLSLSSLIPDDLKKLKVVEN
jgi:hypothetical protein